MPFVEFVSFDIFDTAVYRLVRRPKDLFEILEYRHDIPSLAKKRGLAARQARMTNKEKSIEEITSDEIYQTLCQIDPSISPQKSTRNHVRRNRSGSTFLQKPLLLLSKWIKK